MLGRNFMQAPSFQNFYTRPFCCSRFRDIALQRWCLKLAFFFNLQLGLGIQIIITRKQITWVTWSLPCAKFFKPINPFLVKIFHFGINSIIDHFWPKMCI